MAKGKLYRRNHTKKHTHTQAEIKQSLFADDMNVYAENPKELANKTSETNK